MMKRSKLILIGIFTIACMSFSSTLVNGQTASIATPAAGETYTYNVLGTNGVVEWYDSSFTSLGNITIWKPGFISYTLTGMHPNDELFPGNITGDVWYGDVTIGSVTNFGVNDWTTENASTTEVGWALVLSVSVYPPISWYAGIVAPGNLSEIGNFFDPMNGTSSLNYTLSGGILKVWLAGSFQTSYFEWDEATGVLIYANTQSGSYNLEISLFGSIRGIPGVNPLLTILLSGICVILLGARLIRKKSIQ